MVDADKHSPGSEVDRARHEEGRRETIDIALREYVSKPDYAALLKLAGSDTVDPGYDPKAGDRITASG